MGRIYDKQTYSVSILSAAFGELELDIKPLTFIMRELILGEISAIQALLLCKETMNRENSQGTLDLMNSQYNTNLYLI